jgi:hypothetical protein
MQCSEQILIGILLHVSRLQGSGLPSDPNDYNLNTLIVLLVDISREEVASSCSLTLSFHVALMPVSKIPSLSPALCHSKYGHPLLFAGVIFQNRPRKEKILEKFMGPPKKRCSIFNVFLYDNIF